MTTKSSPTLDKISSLCDDKSSLQARFARISLSITQSSKTLDKLLLLFEYLQLISSFIIFSVLLDSPTKDLSLYSATMFIIRFIVPAYWMSFEKAGFFENSVLILVCAFTLAKLLLFLYILYQCRQNMQTSGILVTIWKVIMKFQSRILYFIVTFFYINATKVINMEPFQILENQSQGIRIFAYTLIGIEFFLAFLPLIFYHYMFPTKSFLSSKDNVLEITSLLQKVFIQVMTGFLNPWELAVQWTFLVMNLCINVSHIVYFCYKLPLYNFKALYFQGRLLVVTLSINISCFVFLVARRVDESFGSISFVLILWAILAFMASKGMRNFLQKMLWRIVCDPSLDSSNLLVHRIIAIKEMLNSVISDKNMGNHDFSCLVRGTMKSYPEKIFWMDDSKGEKFKIDFTSKVSVNMMFKNLLEKLREKYPKNQFIQLFYAELCYKEMKIYGDAIKICLNLKQSSNLKTRLNAEFLLVRIQNHLINEYQSSKTAQLDLLNFISEHAFTAKLKQEMLKQTSIQVKICSEILKESPNLELINVQSQKAQFQRLKILKNINSMSTKLSDFNIEPLLLSAKYHLTLNHSVKNYLDFTKLHSQKLKKYQKFSIEENLCEQNIFQESVGFLLISGIKGEAGKIIHANKAMEDLLGGDSSQDPGVHFAHKSPPIYRTVYEQIWKALSETPETTYFGKVFPGFAYNSSGYLSEINGYVDIHPFATQGFCFILLMRPVSSYREHMIIHENGIIDSASKGLIRRLGLDTLARRTNIKAVCDELVEVNEAFNIIAGKDEMKATMMSKKEAEEIYLKYTTVGNTVIINSLENPDVKYSYHCIMRSELYGSLIIKILTFEENKTSEILQQRRSSDILKTDDEKEEGWIDFDAFMTLAPQSPRKTPTIESPREYPITTERRLISQNSPQKKNEFTYRSSTNDEELTSHRSKAKTSIQTGKTSTSSSRKKVSSLFQTSLDTKCYPKRFWLLFNFFYLSFAGLIALRVILYLTLNKKVEDLVAKKGVFVDSANRTFQLIENAGLMRFVWQFQSGALNISQYTADFSSSLEGTKFVLMGNIQNVRAANRILQNSSSIITGEAHDKLYQRNIKVYETYFDDPEQKFTIMNSFQATDSVFETALAIIHTFWDPVVDIETRARANLYFRNSLNDLVIAGTEMTSLMVDLFDEQYDRVQSITLTFTLIFVGFLSFVFVILAFFFYKEYSLDIFQISAVCRLNQRKIQTISKELLEFQMYLKEESPIEMQNIPVQNTKPASKIREESSNSIKRETIKTPNLKDLQKRYAVYLIAIAFLLVVFLVQVIVKAVADHSIVKKIKQDQERIHFIIQMRNTMTITSTSFRELASTNNTAKMYNRPVIDTLQGATSQLKTFKAQIYDAFLNDEAVREYANVETLFIGDGCNLLSDTFDLYCGILKSQSKSRGFVNLLNGYEDFLKNKIVAYQESNKTKEALAEFQTKDFDILTMTYVIALYELDYLLTAVDEQFKVRIVDYQARRTITFTIFLGLAVVVSALCWIYILKRLREAVNEFKNILRIFPAEVVLGSFILKTFLIKTSKEAIEYSKIEIF